MDRRASALMLMLVLLQWIKLKSGCAVSTKTSETRAFPDLCCGIRQFVIFAFLMAVLLSSRPSAEAASFRIVNFINGTVGVSCYSKDNNLGKHLLHFEDEIAWHFSGMPWTRFWCNFEWNGQTIHEQTWDFFIAIAKSFKMGWWIREEGLFYKPTLLDPAGLIDTWQ